jgi:hypothetical protein
MNLEAGRQVWIPCEVKSGPFSDERMILITSPRGEWLGFVHVATLREPILEGETYVRAVIIEIGEGDTFNARIPGEPLASSMFEGMLDRVQPFALQG